MSQASALRASRSPWPWDGGLCTCAPTGIPVPPAMGPAGLSCCLGEPLLDSAVLSLWALLCFPGVHQATLATSAYLNPQLCPPAAQGAPSDWGPVGCDAARGEGCSGPSAGASALLIAFARPPQPPPGIVLSRAYFLVLEKCCFWHICLLFLLAYGRRVNPVPLLHGGWKRVSDPLREAGLNMGFLLLSRQNTQPSLPPSSITMTPSSSVNPCPQDSGFLVEFPPPPGSRDFSLFVILQYFQIAVFPPC